MQESGVLSTNAHVKAVWMDTDENEVRSVDHIDRVYRTLQAPQEPEVGSLGLSLSDVERLEWDSEEEKVDQDSVRYT